MCDFSECIELTQQKNNTTIYVRLQADEELRIILF